MRSVLLLAWRYVAYNRVKTAILTVCLTLTILLPLATQEIISHYDADLRARAAATPLVVGAKGNRFDLALKALYFTPAPLDPVYMSEYEWLLDPPIEGLRLEPIPLELSFTARGHPVVGTGPEYFDFRGLRVERGRLFQRIGQCVLGARVAAELKLGPGDSLFSDQRRLYDFAGTYPLKMQVVGVLAHSDGPDDRAVFVDYKTCWIMAGLSHGHGDVTRADPNSGLILARSQEEVRTVPGIVEYNEVTDENFASFHTHAAPDRLPLSAIIVVPADSKSATILRGRYATPDLPTQLLVAAEVVDELMRRVFEIQRFFNAAFVLVGLSTVLFVTLIIMLSQRLRRREMETLHKLGASRAMTVWLRVAEFAIIFALAHGAAALLAWAAVLAAPRIVGL